MFCPKCTGEPKGQLRVDKNMISSDEDGDEIRALACDQEPHWFFIKLEVLNGPNEITAADIKGEKSLDAAAKHLGDILQEKGADPTAVYREFVQSLPTLEEYRTRHAETIGNQPRRLRILLAEDDPNLRSAVTRFIQESLDADVLPATNGQEAVGLFQLHGHFDLVVTDFNMPVMTGLEAAQAMLKMNPSQPIILMSGDTEVLEMVNDPRITKRYKGDPAKKLIELIQQLCK
jgi:two-component system, chemotaxis family, chemotaxis protein CheY